MSIQSAFFFDAASCSGCKACQAACKDKNHLPVGVLWRRVYELSGGAWQRDGEAWSQTVFAYNLSMSCNHCVYPKCAGVCPADAYRIRPDGIVLLDTTKCTGCGYCAWACPYEAPQYNAEAGHMTKCDLCWEELEQGLPPACVAACPMRVLEYGETSMERGMALWDTPAESHHSPLPGYSHTQPRLVIKPHPAMKTSAERSVANVEEVRPRRPSNWQELPLMLFTLLTQMAVGGFLAMAWMFPPSVRQTSLLWWLPWLVVGVCLGAAMLASLAHLGTKRNAWRALTHLRKSWLSREILFTALFGAGWLFTTFERVVRGQSASGWLALTAAFGFALLHSMAQVYRLPAAPGWNTWRTNAGFLVSALLLGLAVMGPILAYNANAAGAQTSLNRAGAGILLLLVAQLALACLHVRREPLQRIRLGLMLVGMLLAAAGLLWPGLAAAWFSALLFLIVLGEEGLGRWLFYLSRLEDRGNSA